MTFDIKTIGAASLIAAMMSTTAIAQDDDVTGEGRDGATASEEAMDNEPAVDNAGNAATDDLGEGSSEATSKSTFDANVMMSDEQMTRFLDQGRSGSLSTMDDGMAMGADTSVGVMTMAEMEEAWGETEATWDPVVHQGYVTDNAMLTGAVEAEGYVVEDVQTIYTDADGNVVIVVE